MTQYFRPIPSCDPARPNGAMSLAGGWSWFDRVEVLERDTQPDIIPASNAPDYALARMTAPRPACGPLEMSNPRLMGILNTTPDSFSDGSRFTEIDTALAHARTMLDDGADLIDIGGESTRPGAEEVAIAEEIARTAPVIEALAQQDAAFISLDTRKAAVAEAGLAAGAGALNDVSGLRFDPRLAEVAAYSGKPLILMHSIETPETMQAAAETAYSDALLDVYDGLQAAISTAVAAGVDPNRIIVDPGIGFGKTEAQNLALIARLSLFHTLGCPILLGVSRKGFIGRISGEAKADQRGAGSAAIGLWALAQGVQILRVHDIKLHRQAIDLWSAANAVQ
ncbi:dihydropteroate synthase [Gymnodinialimonas hymeniacidonis]|uniref:dihydropteroate synthase n=1 Tax=Gymnodinialimonas hymeniacidonis TaxID=3126508 RepID=UPI0034C5B24D